jgi:hypothetical protein
MRSAYPAVFLCALACASVPNTSQLSTTGPASPAAASLSKSASADASPARGQLLTGSFMTEYFGGESLYDVLRRRAPLYLNARPNPSALLSNRQDPIAVYINGSYSGALDVLQLIPAQEVFSVKRISAAEAAVRFGPKHNSGALLVTLIPR